MFFALNNLSAYAYLIENPVKMKESDIWPINNLRSCLVKRYPLQQSP